MPNTTVDTQATKVSVNESEAPRSPILAILSPWSSPALPSLSTSTTLPFTSSGKVPLSPRALQFEARSLVPGSVNDWPIKPPRSRTDPTGDAASVVTPQQSRASTTGADLITAKSPSNKDSFKVEATTLGGSGGPNGYVYFTVEGIQEEPKDL